MTSMSQTVVSPRRQTASANSPVSSRRRRWVRRHRVLSVALVVATLLTPVWWSLGSALNDPGMGSAVPARLAEWLRGHGGASFVNWAENTWYSHHAPPVGGKPANGAIPLPGATARRASAPSSGPPPAHLALPAPIVPIASPPVAGEGQWHAVGRRVHGLPAVYEAFLRPDAVHTSVVAGVAWMDTKLLSATLYSGSTIPGGGPWHDTAPVSPRAATTLVSRVQRRLLDVQRPGWATTRRDRPCFRCAPERPPSSSTPTGQRRSGQWGRDVTMAPNVTSVRQNLDLLVDNGKAVPGLERQ